MHRERGGTKCWLSSATVLSHLQSRVGRGKEVSTSSGLKTRQPMLTSLVDFLSKWGKFSLCNISNFYLHGSATVGPSLHSLASWSLSHFLSGQTTRMQSIGRSLTKKCNFSLKIKTSSLCRFSLYRFSLFSLDISLSKFQRLIIKELYNFSSIWNLLHNNMLDKSNSFITPSLQRRYVSLSDSTLYTK